MLPLPLRSPLRQQVHGAHEVARVEVFGVDPGEEIHLLVFRPQRDLDAFRALLLHVREEAADEIGQEIGAQRPARPEVAEDPEHVRDAREHHPAVGHGLREVERLPVDLEADIAQDAEVEAGGRDDDVRLKFPARFQADAVLRECLDLVGDDRRLARFDALEDVAIGDEGDALPPWPVGWGEVLLHVEVRPQVGSDAVDQLLLHGFGLFEGAAREDLLVVQELAADDLVDPGLVDLQLAKGVGEVVHVAAGNEVGRRTLEDGDMAAVGRHRGHDGGGGGAGADDEDVLALVVEVLRPGLGMDDLALEVIHARPFRRVPLGVAVVALAHPEEAGREVLRLAGIRAGRLDRPAVLCARPLRRGDPVVVADVPLKAVLLDHLAHVLEDLFGGGDGCARPRLEAVAEGIEVAIGADAGVAVHPPGPAEAIEAFEDDEAGARALGGEVVGATDPGDARANDEDIEVFRLCGGGPGQCFGCGHGCWSPHGVKIRPLAGHVRTGGPDGLRPCVPPGAADRP